MQTTKPGPTTVAGRHLQVCGPQGRAGPLSTGPYRSNPDTGRPLRSPTPRPSPGVGGYLLPPSESWRSRVSLESR